MIAPTWINLSGPERSLTVFGVKMIGIDAATGHKLLLTGGFVAAVVVISWVLERLLGLITRNQKAMRWAFWSRQAVRLMTALLLVVGFLSIWFNDTARLATFLGLVSAGLAFALQRVVTAFAGYIVILRGNTFTVGDRITMGGVRGDVIKLSFIQTTIMEMGEPPAEQADDPAMWVRSRQYTGRVVTVTNDKIFDNPVYNFTKEFPYIWEEMRIPISYKADRGAAEQILLRAVRQHTLKIAELGEEAVRNMERRYVMKKSELEPRVYMRLTDNWVELSVRFLTPAYDVRLLKDQISRQIIDELDKAHIGIASSTYDIVGMPPIQVNVDTAPVRNADEKQRN